MILTAHLLLGALTGYKITILPLAIILAVLGHYFLDLVPHIEYPVSNIFTRNWKKSFPDFFWVFLDFSTGIALITLFSNKNPVIYFCAFVAILPDMTTLLSLIFPNRFLKAHDVWHQKIHFLEDKKISKFWRLFFQVATIIICVALLR